MGCQALFGMIRGSYFVAEILNENCHLCQLCPPSPQILLSRCISS